MEQSSLSGMASRVLVQHPHVRMDADVLGGSPYVAGTRVPVRRLWAWHQGGLTVETLLKRYPQLGPAKVLDALAFAYDNRELVDEDLAREREMLSQAEQAPAGPAVVLSPTALRAAAQAATRAPVAAAAGRKRLVLEVV